MIVVVYGNCAWVKVKCSWWRVHDVLLICLGQDSWTATALFGGCVGADNGVGRSNCSCRAWAGTWPDVKAIDGESDVVELFFGFELSKSDIAWPLDVCFIFLDTFTSLRWPVLSIMSCSSTFAWYNLFAVVARSEWFIRKPEIPASVQGLATVPCRRLWPIGFTVNQQLS